MSVDLDPKYIYRGVWRNVDRGAIMGKTLTTDSQTGALLVAILAVLITLGTAHLWHLVSFVVYQIRADGRPRDGMFRQQQALLRTLPSPSTIMADTVKLWWAWRRHTKNPFLRNLVLFSLALLTTAGTISASIFSSFIVDSSDLVVLVDSPFCGAPLTDRLAGGAGYMNAVLSAGIKLGPQCQKVFDNVNNTMPKACGAFYKHAIGMEGNTTFGPCPFAKDMCTPEAPEEAVHMDSRLLDANKDFGMNLPADSRVQFRRRSTCSVLSLKGRTKIHNVSDHFMEFGRTELMPGEQAISMNYGAVGERNFTTMTSLLRTNVTFTFDQGGLRYFANSGLPVPNEIDLIPELRRNDGDTILKTIGLNGLRYVFPVDDPLFSAHKPYTGILALSDTGEVRNITTYSHDDPLKAIGCLQQYQFCHARPSKKDFCTDLIPLPANATAGDFPYANKLQQTVIQLFLNTSYYFDSSNPTNDFAVRSMALPPSKSIVPYVDDGMWYLQLLGWERSIWATIQIAVMDWAIGPNVREGHTGNWTRPSTAAEKQLCKMQRMRVSGHVVNINVFALAFIIAFSSLITIVDIMILKFLVYLSRFRRALAPRIDRWIQDGIWQLQRRAYEGEGYRNWVNLEEEIPLTKQEQKLKDLPILWLPGKSPEVGLGAAFASTDSLASQHTLPMVRVRDEESTGTAKKRGVGWLRFFRR
ncbi:hypothetical protein P153DRAFT_382375 [Dothidotthia symphoricarpi CBS 119687]|uniref:Uncharacterized protein n=1 Tax=Dothidotthia symphoricarpi CBS 119687 TaxID=1392245 RepID=A0A6A6ALS0_9PLEO|nr:uncharacterized protein P153DRAFT_382375 [Dothidotthia symphoricarpi CBS 119687]KAF2132750.1 hypothetical protein P153DRAFT_382375 [Dothidotthia symphoricarpi CBS 119687]